MKLKDKVAVITGASSGIGRAIATEFARQGALVIINYSNSIRGAEEAKKEIEDFGGSAVLYKCNVADLKEVEAMIDQIIGDYKKIDILVNNSGITKDNLLMRMSEEEFDDVINVNLKGTFNTIKCVSRHMIKAKHGKIINMASVVGITGNSGQGNYAASKGGVISLTKSAAKEFASRNICVNAIAPGYIETRMTDVLSDKIKEEILSKIPAKRIGKPEDIAKTAVFLASEDSNYITGQVINVDGGMVM